RARPKPPGAELNVSPERVRELTFDALMNQMRGLTRQKPVLLVFEDVHWIDPTSAELLAAAIDAIVDLPVMIMATSRTGCEPTWLNRSHVTHLKLERLEREDGSELVSRVAGQRSLPPEIVGQIVRQTDGVPLFVEELTKTLMDSDLLEPSNGTDVVQGPLPTGAIPVTLKDSLMARLDRLGPGREVAQVASVIGREFSHELLAAVAEREAGLGEDELADALDRLIEGGLLSVVGSKFSRQYGFRHALVRDTAHESLLRKRRQALHGAVVEALETRFKDTVATAPEVLARHCQEASLTTKAVEYWLAAGRRASENSANAEAVAHLRQGLALVEDISAHPTSRRLELELLIALGPALVSTEGPGSLTVERNYTRTLELCKEVPRSTSHFKAHWGWWFISMNHEVGRNRADTLLELARELKDAGCELQAHHCQWATLFHLGDYRACCEHIEAGLELYDHHRHRYDASEYGGHDARVCGEGEHAVSSWILGNGATADRRISRCLRWAQALRHIPSTAHAFFYELMLSVYRMNVQAVARLAPAMVEFAVENKLPAYQADGLFFSGWARCELAGRKRSAKDATVEMREGIGAMREGLKMLLSIGTKEELPTLYDLLARTCARQGDVREALGFVDAGFEASERSGQNFWLAELYRCRADLLLMQDDKEPSIDANLDAALATASGQGARWFRLRAVMSLARLRRAQGRAAEGHAALQSELDNFEGDLGSDATGPDITHARALLATL
ncbi:MAG: ATP-binding protein, partial [Gammaproteobacteria bacterium]